VQEGLLTKQTLLNTRQQLDDANSEPRRPFPARPDRGQGAGLRNRREEEVRAGEMKLDQQERTVAELEREIKANTEVVAQQTGRILEILAEQGAVVADGDPY
jgi:hypothetical protein